LIFIRHINVVTIFKEMRTYLVIIGILIVIFVQTCKNEVNTDKLGLSTEQTKSSRINKEYNQFSINYYKVDSVQQSEIVNYIETGILLVEDFFNQSFDKHIDVYIFPERKLLDKQWQQDWNMPEFESQCWMVASATAYRLDILSPGVWPEEACEHDAENKEKLKKLVLHELIHVYHGQQSPDPGFDGMDEIGWFMEGIAVYASGQYDSDRKKRTKEAYELNKIPKKLEDIWSGEYRYALAGSIVDVIELKYGRSKVSELLIYTTQTQLLQALQLSESELLSIWDEYLSRL